MSKLIVDRTDQIDPDARSPGERFGPRLRGAVAVLPDTRFQHVSSAVAVKIALSELNFAATNFALAFRPESDGGLTLVALLGLHQPRNLYVSPAGEWMGNYVPAQIRRYPFRITEQGANGPRLELSADFEGIVPADRDGAIRLFEEGGGPSPYLTRMERFATRLHYQQRITDQGCRSLRVKDVLREWPLTLDLGGREVRIPGLMRIDEEALAALPSRDFLRLRHTGGLKVAYAQIMSMRNITTLSWMYRLHEHRETALQHQTPDTPQDFLLSDQDSFSFTEDATLEFGDDVNLFR